MAKGFGLSKIPKEFVDYHLELKIRMNDDSELLVGTAILQVPHLKHRDYEDAIAVSATAEFLTGGYAPTEVNQIFVFTGKSRRFVDRIELREWQDSPCQTNSLNSTEQSLIAIAYNQCKIKLSLLPRPVVA